MEENQKTRMSTLNKKSRKKSTDTNNTAITGMTEKERLLIKKTAEIVKNPVLWAKAFLRTVDNASKKVVPWTARWYQAEMLLSDAVKIVARCGRRTGEHIFCPSSTNCLEVYIMHKKV